MCSQDISKDNQDIAKEVIDIDEIDLGDSLFDGEPIMRLEAEVFLQLQLSGKSIDGFVVRREHFIPQPQSFYDLLNLIQSRSNA